MGYFLYRERNFDKSTKILYRISPLGIMEKPIDKFFNDISLSGLEGLAQQNQEDISSILKSLEETFTNRIEGLKWQSVGNITRTQLLNSSDNVEFIIRAMVDEASLKTQTEFINHWIAKMILCQKTIVLLVKDLLKWCDSYKWNWSKYCENDQAAAFYRNRLFLTILKSYIRINGLCQNIGLAVSDYFYLYGQIKSNISIKEKDFIKPNILDPETRMSERISNLNKETGNCLLINPEKSILGFAAVRMQLESFIAIKLQDRMRQNIRLKEGNNKHDVKYTSKLRRTDVFEMIKDILPCQKEYGSSG
jgi:hypothetical protein